VPVLRYKSTETATKWFSQCGSCENWSGDRGHNRDHEGLCRRHSETIWSSGRCSAWQPDAMTQITIAKIKQLEKFEKKPT
jgi:hypothetical protein